MAGTRGVVAIGGIDERIACECVSCFPEKTDNTCNCAWRFTLDE